MGWHLCPMIQFSGQYQHLRGSLTLSFAALFLLSLGSRGLFCWRGARAGAMNCPGRLAAELEAFSYCLAYQ